jgi:CO dehydrogenase maturation factor
MKIAISGKGGTGKSTLAAGLIQLLLKRGHQVFAVDADPDVSLGLLLGFPVEEINKLKPIVDMEDLIKSKTGDVGLFILNPEVDDIVRDHTLTKDKLQFLRMGAVKAGGSSCYCQENSVLNALVATLLLQESDYLILDMGAGIEHLTRGTASGVDLMLIVTEPSLVSINTAQVICRLAEELGIAKLRYIGNRVRNEAEQAFLEEKLGKENMAGFIPYSEMIAGQSLTGDYAAKQIIPEGLPEIANKITL